MKVTFTRLDVVLPEPDAEAPELEEPHAASNVTRPAVAATHTVDRLFIIEPF
jgi:hypothetical protein